jgi:hypothetical protein
MICTKPFTTEGTEEHREKSQRKIQEATAASVGVNLRPKRSSKILGSKFETQLQPQRALRSTEGDHRGNTRRKIHSRNPEEKRLLAHLRAERSSQT